MKRYSKKLQSLLFLPLTLVFSVSACTNYTTEEITVNPPVLLGIEEEDTGHVLEISAFNQEVVFLGYRLFVGISEEQVRNMNDSEGIDCSMPLSVQTTTAGIYYIEVKPDQLKPGSGKSRRVCSVPVSLSTGSWVALRSVRYRDFLTTETGSSSNALPVP